MKRLIAIVLSLVMMISMSMPAFAMDEEPYITQDPIEEYTSILSITASLTRSGSSATCNLGVTQKISLDSMSGTLKLLNSAGNTVSTKSGTFIKSGSVYTMSKSFDLPSNGTYKVQFTIKTYKNDLLQETASGYTNTITK